MPALGVLLVAFGQELEDFLELLVIRGIGRGDFAGVFIFVALVDQERGIAAVVDDLVGTAAVAEIEGTFGAPPIFFESSRPSRRKRACPCGLSTVPLGPTATAAAAWSWVLKILHEHHRTLRAQRRERFDQHGGLNRHVQASP